MEFKVIPFEVKSTTEDGSEGEGYGNAFHVLDKAGEIVAPGALDDALPDFFKDGFIGGLNHDWNNPIGRPVSGGVDGKGLRIVWKISDTSHGRDVKILLKDKVIKKLSIGYNVAGYEMLKDEKAVRAYWQMHGYQPDEEDLQKARHGAKLLTKIRPLYEVSPVTVPANRASDVLGVKAIKVDRVDMSALEDFLRDAEKLSRAEAREWIHVYGKYQDIVERFKTLLCDAGSANEPEHGVKSVVVGNTLRQFEAQFLTLQMRHLSRAGEINDRLRAADQNVSGEPGQVDGAAG